MNYREYYNNGSVIFTEIEFIKENLGASSTYLRARNKLIEVGFIRITYKAEKKNRGICNQYKILVPNRGVPEKEQRWYPLKNWS